MKKTEKNILIDCSRGLFIGGLLISVIVVVAILIGFLLFFFLDKSNIIDYFINNSGYILSSEKITYFINIIINILMCFILNYISVILGFMGYLLNNKMLKIGCVTLSVIVVFIMLFSSISYMIIPFGTSLSCLIFSLYLEKKAIQKYGVDHEKIKRSNEL